jgi:outer membrane receptor protein involved in Fe transport
MTGYQVLLTVDELRLNDALTRAGGHALLNLIDPESVERIEVVRGPASVVHGSDALGGYVHVTTQRTGAGPSTSPHADATAYVRGASAERAVRVAGEVSAVDKALGLRVSGGRGYAGSLLRGGDHGEQPYTGFQDWTFASRLEAAPSRAHRITLAHQSGHLFDMPRSDTSTPEDFEITKSLDRDAMVVSYTGRDFEHSVRLHAYAGLSLV